MVLLDVLVLIQEVDEGSMLGSVERARGEIAVHFVEIVISHDGDVGTVLLIEREAGLHIGPDVVVQDAGRPVFGKCGRPADITGRLFRIQLSPATPVPEDVRAEAQLHAGRVEIEPAVAQVELELARIVHEAVHIMVHRLEIAVRMAEEHGAPFAFIVQLQGTDDIEVRLGIVHHGRLHIERFLVGGFAVLQVDLARHRFHAVDDRRDAFGDLDAFQPLPGHVIEPEGSGQAPHRRAVLIQHLRVDAVLAQEPDLARACDGVGVADRHARGVFETLRQVAAGHLAEARRRDDLGADVLALGQKVAVAGRGEHRLHEGVLALAVDADGIRRLHGILPGGRLRPGSGHAQRPQGWCCYNK